MPTALSLLLVLPGFVLGLLAYGAEDVAAGNEVLVELRRLAEQGDAQAQSNLGVMYDTGQGVPEDDVEAVKWFRMGPAQGDAVAQFNLGVMYNNGEGVPEDYVRAYAWCNLAAAQGYEPAVKAKASLRERMTAKQIARAQELSSTFSQRVREKADLQAD